MPESSPISMFCAQIVGIQGMSDLWGFKTHVHTTRTNVSSNSALTSYYWTGAPVGCFLNRAFTAIVCERDAFFSEKKIEGTKYSVSTVLIYYCSKFLRDVFL